MRTPPKDLYRRLEALLDAAAGAGDVDARLQACLEGVLEVFGEPFGLRSVRLAVEHRTGFAWASGRVGEDGPPPSAADLGDEPVQIEPVPSADGPGGSGPGDSGQDEFGQGEFGLGQTESRALLILGDAPARRLACFRLDPAEEGSGDGLQVWLSSLRSLLAAHLLEARLGDTLREAALIQGSLLPARPPAFPGFELAARCVAASDVGGDLYDFQLLSDGLLALAVGDASGHGLPAALLARDVVTGLRMGLEGDLRTGNVLGRLNAVVHRSALSSCFVSLFLAELEDNGSLFYFNAGHEPPLLFGPDGSVEDLARGELVLGPLPDTRFKRRFAHVDRGGTLLMFSDGLLERRASCGELFGRERLRDAAEGALSQGPEAVVEAVFRAAERFGRSSGPGWEDDATLVVVQRHADSDGR